jgi:hypothetical protein
MKKLLLVLVTGLCFTVYSNAKNADLFNYNKEVVNKELSDLQTLENYVSANPGTTLTDLQANNNELASKLNLNTTDLSGFMASFEPPLGVPSFLWGCVFSVAGVAVVYFVADDKEETKKAFKGCVVNGVTYLVIYVIYYVIVIAAVSSSV